MYPFLKLEEVLVEEQPHEEHHRTFNSIMGKSMVDDGLLPLPFTL